MTRKKGGIGGVARTLGGLFWSAGDEPAPAEDSTDPALDAETEAFLAEGPRSPVSAKTTTVVAPTVVPGAPDLELQAQVRKALGDKAPSALQKFLAILDSLQAIPDPAQRYQTALKLMETVSGVTPAQLLTDLATYEAEIQRYGEGARQFAEREIEREVGGRQNQINLGKEQIAEMERMLAEMQLEMQKLRDSEGALEAEMATESQRIEGVRDQTLAVVGVELHKLELLRRQLNPESEGA